MILAVTGLQREARILAGPGVEVVAGAADLDLRAAGKRGVISIGIAGALAPGLKPGDWVVADAVRDRDELLPTDRDWTARLASRLSDPQRGVFLGSDTIAATAARKAELHRATGAIAVDMESHRAARAAQRHGLPFAAARVISDAADRTLPPAARVGMKSDGAVDLPAVLRSLLLAPWHLPALIRTGLEAETSFRALLRGHRMLGPGLGGPTPRGSYLGELPPDMV
jgi:hopanoid-associated phosphorylase